MTEKEFNIQRALGTLPLWQRIELGDIELIEESSNLNTVTKLTCKNLSMRYYYRNNILGARESCLRRLINDCKKGGWEN